MAPVPEMQQDIPMPSKPANPEVLYHQIGALLAVAPNLRGFDKDWHLPSSTIQWLAKATALVRAGAPVGTLYSPRIEMAVQNLVATVQTEKQANEIILILNQVQAVLELQIPVASKGAFVSAGETFDAFSAVAKILGEAREAVLIVDPYMDATVVVDFAGLVPEGVHLRLLGDEATSKPALKPSADRWIAQHGIARPLSVRLAAPRSLHDRLIIVDDSTAWILTQSLKDFAKRAHASVQRADAELGQMKVAAFFELWNAGEVLASTTE